MKIDILGPHVTVRPRLDVRVAAVPARTQFTFVMYAAAGTCAVVLLAHSGAREPVYGEAAAVFGSALASSIAGFAFSALCGGLLFHDGSTPRHVVQLLVISNIAIQAFGVVALRRSIRWGALWPYLGGGAFGLPIGLFVLYHVPTPTYARALGIFLVAYGAALLWRRPFVVPVGTRMALVIATFVGFLSGITGGAAGSPGPCVSIWCAHRGWDKIQQRSTSQPFMLIMQIATLAALFTIGPSASEPAALFDFSAFAFVPVALCGTYLGLRVFHRLSDRGFARYLALLLIASGIGLAGVR